MNTMTIIALAIEKARLYYRKYLVNKDEDEEQAEMFYERYYALCEFIEFVFKKLIEE